MEVQGPAISGAEGSLEGQRGSLIDRVLIRPRSDSMARSSTELRANQKSSRAANALTDHSDELHAMEANEEKELKVEEFPYCDNEQNRRNTDGYPADKAREGKMREMASITHHGVFREVDASEARGSQ
eukprot:9145969-Alexandrium_andersonii.AAC.1